MPPPVKRLQPRSYHAFRCIGAECEDTCCIGWIVNVDKQTYANYQDCRDPDLGPRLRELVTINPASPSEDNYARIMLSGPGCPFLDDGLCSVQKDLGEEYLSIMCSLYPRVMNVVDDVLQRSLDLSCPEAARVALLDPNPMVFDETDDERSDPRLAHLSILSTADESAQKPYKHFRELRSFVIWLLQNRDYSLWKRMTILGSLCDQLHASASETPQILAGYREAVERGLFDQALDTHLPRSAAQLSLVLELIVSRIGADFTAPRFRECYQEFMAGLDWTAEIGMDELGRRYGSAYSEWYLPLMSQHQHILEHYLVNYVHRTLFPLGPQESSRNLSAANIASSIRDQCLMMFAYFAIVQTVSIGMAAFHRESFDVAHVLKIIQSTAKAFEHSLAFPPAALQVIANNDIANCANMAILLLN